MTQEDANVIGKLVADTKMEILKSLQPFIENLQGRIGNLENVVEENRLDSIKLMSAMMNDMAKKGEE